MPAEENKELRDLVTETLKSKGVLGKVQAEVRASVFLALEEQDVFKDKSPFVNKPLKDFLQTDDGLLAVSLVREFLEFFNLEFTSSVFEPETHAGIDYTYTNRVKLAKDLMLPVNEKDKSAPLLSHVIEQLKSISDHSTRTSRRDQTKSNNESLDLLNFTPDRSLINGNVNDRSRSEKSSVDDKTQKSEAKQENLASRPTTLGQKEATSMASLSDLPPIVKKSNSSNRGTDLYNLKSLAELKLADSNSASNSIQESLKDNSNSEIEEELSHQSVASGNSDNTVDVSLSKASGVGDYMEDV